jgi:hypothetical protein
MKSKGINDIYESFRILRENNNTKENENKTPDAVPYSAQDTLMTNILASCKQEFGADFNEIKNPMLYYPEDGDITLSGVIPEMNDAKFQFRYKVGDGAGCYVWSNPYLPISDKTIQTLQKVNGVCKNWRDEISKSEDCRPSNFNDPKDVQDNTQGQVAGTSASSENNQQSLQERKFKKGDDIIEYNRIFRRGDDL